MLNLLIIYIIFFTVPFKYHLQLIILFDINLP